MIKAMSPPEAYRQLQRSLLESMEHRVPNSHACRKKLESEHSMKERLERMMMERFGLRAVPSHHLAIDMEKKLNELFQKSHCHFLDHQTAYKVTVVMGSATVFV